MYSEKSRTPSCVVASNVRLAVSIPIRHLVASVSGVMAVFLSVDLVDDAVNGKDENIDSDKLAGVSTEDTYRKCKSVS